MGLKIIFGVLIVQCVILFEIIVILTKNVADNNIVPSV